MYQSGLKINKLLTLLILTIALPLLSYGQKTKAQLEKEKRENINKIRQANHLLQATESERKSTLAQLTILEKEIEARQELINSIGQEVDLINSEIGEIGGIINALQRDEERLKKEYAEMIYQASKNQGYFDKLTFIFSAETFNQLVMRLKYFQKFSESRKYQVEQIDKVMATLAGQKVKLKLAWNEKNNLLAEKKTETEKLAEVKEQQAELLTELAKREKDLKQEVAQRQKENKKLEKLIEDIVRREIEKARREAERKAREAKKAAKKSPGLTPEAKTISGNFSANVHKLPWPVLKGEIVGKFGKHPHPVLKGVTVENMGIDILTLRDEAVRSVFDGKVVTVADVPGMNKVVMIQHGNYYTVYAKLKSVSVSNGQKVTSKEVIGYVHDDKDGNAQLQFQVWKNSEKLDPENWLNKR